MSVRRFVLASQSPRRRQILTISGYDFDILPSQISEIPDENLNLTSQIRQLALDKAEACLKMGKTAKGHGFLVLASDTVVVFNDHILGKPKDEIEARSFLRRLSGQTHDVITAISLVDVDTGRTLQDHAVTHVKFRPLSEDQIAAYVATGDPMDKAGGYGIQHAEAANFIESFDGDYDTVVGLPMALVERAIKNFGVEVQKRPKIIAENFERVRREIALAAHDRQNVQLIAVSKTKPATDVIEAWQTGQTVFAENYVQEALSKIDEVNELMAMSRQGEKTSIEWHFIGGLQSKKVKQVIGRFALIHSVDRISLIEEIEKRAAEKNLIQPCLLQINIADEATKAGVSSTDFLKLLDVAINCRHIQLRGVMALPPLTDDKSLSRLRFADVRRLFETARDRLPESRRKDFCELSMGTTHDFSEAILEGATMIRIGTALFGSR